VAIEPRRYADSSALVKLVLLEPESRALERHLAPGRTLTSELAIVEISRSEKLADPPSNLIGSASSLLDRLELVAITTDVLRHAAELTSDRLRSLDAIHLATALAVEPDELIAYDQRLLDAAADAGLTTVSPR
jgi:predicted nucleic acid-binding protein